MLVLGQKYKFTKLELDRLKKQFSTVNEVIYKDKDSGFTIKQIESSLGNGSFTLIVLNTKAKVDDEIIKYLTNLKFKVSSAKFEIISIEHFLEKYLHKCYIPEDNNDLHYLDDIKPLTFGQNIQKKLVDIVAMFGLFFVFIIIKPFVRKKVQQQSPGSLYFKQLRVGLNNKEFECIKFRSMYEDAEKNGAMFASKDDPRVFAFGETMRKTRIDEIPQVFNILKGEMSLIGPRPERKHWIEKDFEKAIPYYNQRHVIKPGITGWAQVMYPYGDGIVDAKQKLMYDLYYIKHWSLVLELKVIWKTIMVVLGKKGL
jgi:lipopolysaccharide/colanic/teichoic acid biosynthesis glycosyltransferase